MQSRRQPVHNKRPVLLSGVLHQGCAASPAACRILQAGLGSNERPAAGCQPRAQRWIVWAFQAQAAGLSGLARGHAEVPSQGLSLSMKRRACVLRAGPKAEIMTMLPVLVTSANTARSLSMNLEPFDTGQELRVGFRLGRAAVRERASLRGTAYRHVWSSQASRRHLCRSAIGLCLAVEQGAVMWRRGHPCPSAKVVPRRRGDVEVRRGVGNSSLRDFLLEARPTPCLNAALLRRSWRASCPAWTVP